MTTSQSAPSYTVNMDPSWTNVLHHEFNQPYMKQLSTFIAAERAGAIPIYPPSELVFNAFNTTPYDKVKVVIMGQDPYHGPGQAHGLSFSVPHGVSIPPSLKNIYKELQADLGITPPTHGCLLHWAEQGVLLLNATLTVRQNDALSHHGRGWERFTDAVVNALCERQEPVIFVLWGKSAQAKCNHILTAQGVKCHAVLTAAHPSPFSAYQGFFGCRHFSQINALLHARGVKPIDWCL